MLPVLCVRTVVRVRVTRVPGDSYRAGAAAPHAGSQAATPENPHDIWQAASSRHLLAASAASGRQAGPAWVCGGAAAAGAGAAAPAGQRQLQPSAQRACHRRRGAAGAAVFFAGFSPQPCAGSAAGDPGDPAAGGRRFASEPDATRPRRGRRVGPGHGRVGPHAVRHGGQCTQQRRFCRPFRPKHGHGQPGPVGPHRAAGGQPGRNGRQRGTAVVHGSGQCRHGWPGQ